MLKETIAAAFKSKGKSSMKKSELILTLSFDLGWFSHEDAKKVVELALQQEILKENEELHPTFNLDEVDIPIDFRPDLSRILSVFDQIVHEIAEKTGKSVSEIISLINKKQEELGNILSVEVTALIVAKSFGIDVSKYIDRVEREILK